jgi:hypothetical protein
LKRRKKYESNFFFQPGNLQSATNSQRLAFYNNAVFNWNGEEGLKAVLEILEKLLKREPQSAASGQ